MLCESDSLFRIFIIMVTLVANAILVMALLVAETLTLREVPKQDYLRGGGGTRHASKFELLSIPRDCIWGDWSDWTMDCPACLRPDLFREGERMSVHRTRQMKYKGNKFGVCYSHNDTNMERSMKMSERIGPETQDKVCDTTILCASIARGVGQGNK